MANRIACTALTGRIMMGRTNAAGTAFAGANTDVTSDVLKAVIDKAAFHGGSFDIEGGGEKWVVTVAKAGAAPMSAQGAPSVVQPEPEAGKASMREALEILLANLESDLECEGHNPSDDARVKFARAALRADLAAVDVSPAHVEAWTWFDAAGEYHLERDEPEDGAEVFQLTPLAPATQAAQSAAPTNPWAAALEIRMAQGWKLKGDRLPVLYTDTINGDGVGRDDLWLCTTAALAAPVAAQDADDAAPAAAAVEQWDALWPAARDVISERRRQVSAEGWTAEHDDEHENGSLSDAAACYAMQAYGTTAQPRQWPWSSKWWKPSEDPRRNLEKAGALILAEMERLDRAAARAQQQEGGAA